MFPRLKAKHAPDFARECVSYCAETGTFTWLERPREHFANQNAWRRWNNMYPGTECGSKVLGRWVICLSAVKYPAPHIVWALEHGRWPTCYIDHINGDKMDNRLVNLREVDEIGNARNCKLRADNSSGVPGVYQDKWGNWYAQISDRGKRHGLGYFYTFEDARDARALAERRLGYHPNHGRDGPLTASITQPSGLATVARRGEAA